MRVIEPKKHSSDKSKNVYRKHSRALIFSWFLLFIIGSFGLYKYAIAPMTATDISTSTPGPVAEVAKQSAAPETKPGSYKIFTGQQFKDLYYSVGYPNTQQIQDPISITGNFDADKRIRSIAESRGYKQTSIPQNPINRINEPRLNGDDLLQPLAADGWTKLKELAKNENIPLSIISAYRSPEWQRDLFLQRLYANGVTPAQVAAGIADKAVNATLVTAAVPGYSRHHTGYTIDLWCEDGSGAFAYSSCFRWIKNNNYQRAKEAGWIPSYPEGTNEQGPEPEPWEYVWVGKGVLTD
ncbi:D-alanyl-D-alanine carboxypeptidase family protein [Candidatus Saccharibacteria bacterium]|nr:D-alanyl-D-alanine carboxypeptidase family protein [Candidatus Saccharibacteria bacterium]